MMSLDPEDRNSAASSLLSEMKGRGVQLSIDDGVLRFRAPPGALDRETRERISGLRDEIMTILSGGQPGREPLSERQLRLWLIHKRQKSSREYQMSAVFRLTGPLDVTRLELALGAVIEDNPALQKVVTVDQGEPVLTTHSSGRPKIPVLEVSGASDGVIQQIAAEIAAQPIDLAEGPLIRAVLLRLAPLRHAFVLVVHHIICDDHSMRLICHKLLTCYEASSVPGREIGRSSVAVADQAATASQATVSSGQVSARREALNTAGVTRLPQPLSPASTPPWSASSHITLLDRKARGKWEDGRRSAGVTTLILTLALIGVAVAACGGPADVLVGTPWVGRESAAESMTVGYYATTIVVRVNLRACLSFGDLLDLVRHDFREALAVRQVPYETFAGAASHSAYGGHVLWVVTYAVDPLPTVTGLDVEPVFLDGEQARHDLRVALADRLDMLEIRQTYRLSAVDAQFASRLAAALGLLHRAVPDRRALLSEVIAGLRHQLEINPSWLPT